MDFGDILALFATLGLGGILTQTAKAILARLTGRADREQDAWAQRDAEARHRRVLEEALHDTRECLRRHGVPYADMPAWPRRPDRK